MISKFTLSRISSIFLVPGLILFITSCQKVDASHGPKKDNRIETIDFNKIVLHTGGTLNYTQSSQTQVSVNTTQEVFNALNIFVKNQTLHIKSKSGFNILNQDEIVFNVSDDDTYSIEVCGSGDVNADFDENYHFENHKLIISGSGNIIADEVYAQSQHVRISGSGDVKINYLNVSESDTDISGSGSIHYLSGNAANTKMDINGSGDIRSYEMSSQDAEVMICGSGDIQLRAQNSLDIDISGSGDVWYKGKPTVASSVSGSGNVFDAN